MSSIFANNDTSIYDPAAGRDFLRVDRGYAPKRSKLWTAQSNEDGCAAFCDLPHHGEKRFQVVGARLRRPRLGSRTCSHVDAGQTKRIVCQSRAQQRRPWGRCGDFRQREQLLFD